MKAMGAYCGQKTGRLGASTGSKSNNNCVGCRAASIVYGAWLVSMRFVSHRAARCFYGREGQAGLEDHKLKESKFHILENSVLSVDVLKVIFFIDVLKAIFFDLFFVEFALNLVCAFGH